MIIKILKIDSKRLRNREHLQFVKQILATLFKYEPEKLNILMLCEELSSLVAEEEIAISVESGSVLTAVRDAADNRRKRLHSALNSYVKAFLFDEEETAKFEAAQRVMRIIRQVGNPWQMADQAETTMLTELGNQLMTYDEDVNLIGAEYWMEKLMDANDCFVAVDNQCREEKANRPSGNVSAVRERLTPIYTAIVDAINGDITRYRDNRFDAVVMEINAIIREYLTLLQQRKTKSATNITAPETPENPPAEE